MKAGNCRRSEATIGNRIDRGPEEKNLRRLIQLLRYSLTEDCRDTVTTIRDQIRQLILRKP
jgi:hypothetical protein